MAVLCYVNINVYILSLCHRLSTGFIYFHRKIYGINMSNRTVYKDAEDGCKKGNKIILWAEINRFLQRNNDIFLIGIKEKSELLE